MKIPSQYYIPVLLLIAGLIFLTHLGLLYVDIMEARNFVSAREMVTDKHWVFTTLNGEPRYEKPPLPTWLSAFMGKIFGTEAVWALRFPAGLVSVALVFYLYKIVELITQNKKWAFHAGLIFSTSFLVVFVGKRATWDIFSYSFMVIGSYYFLKIILSKKLNPADIFLCGLFIGFSFLSKGPTGPYVIMLPIIIAYLICFKIPEINRFPGLMVAGVIALIIGLSWYAWIYVYDHAAFLSIMDKEANARTNRDVKPFTRYLSFFIQMGIWCFFSLFSLFFVFLKKTFRERKNYLFFLYWTLFALVFISLIPSKKERYLFPVMIPLSVITAYVILYLTSGENKIKWQRIFTKIVFVIIGIAALVIPGMLFILKTPAGFFSIGLGLVSFLIGIAVLYVVLKQNQLQKACQLALVFMVVLMIFGIPVIDGVFYSNPHYKSLLLAKDKIKESGLNLYSYHTYAPEVWFKYGEKIPYFDLSTRYKIPDENQFYIIIAITDDTQQHLEHLEEHGFQMRKIGIYNDNEEKEGSKNYVTRKLHALFLVNKKSFLTLTQ